MMRVVLPHYRSILPYITDDQEAKASIELMLSSPDFDQHIEKFFIDDIKDNLQGPINEKMMKSGELANQMVTLAGNILKGLTAMKNAAGTRTSDLDNNIETRESRSSGSMLQTMMNVGYGLKQFLNMYSAL